MAKAAAITVTLLTLSGAYRVTTAEAHMLKQRKHESKAHYAHRLIHHAKTGIRWIKQHPIRYRHYRKYRKVLRNHYWLLRYGKELQPKPKPRKTLNYPPHYSQWMCIHSYEGAWNANTGNGYYGGLQFGWSEWMTFGGRFGYPVPASAASPAQQMWAAERYYNVSGFSPWPNTARYCGLL